MNRITLLLGLVVTSTAVAQTPSGSSLKDFIDAADQHNIDRRISAEQRLGAAAQLTQAWSALLPSLTAQGIWTNNQYPAVVSLKVSDTQTVKLTITPENQIDGVLRVDLPIIDTTRWFRTLSADSNSQAAEQRELATREQVKRQVVGTYYSLAAAKALVQSAQKSMGVAQAQLDLQTTRVRSGVVTELDQMRAKAEVERTRQTVADATSLVATTARSLRTLSGVEPGDVAGLPVDDLHVEAPVADLEGKVENLPAILAAQKDLEVASQNHTANTLALVPVVGGQFTERLTNATGFTGQPASYNLGVNLTWRLDGPTLVAPRIAQSQQNVAALAIERTKLAARDQVFSDWQRIQATIIKVQATGVQVQAAQRAEMLAKERYEAGVATQIDVIQSERDVFQAEVAQIQAQTELASARASLRISTGQPVIAENEGR
jgi:outer membrane protein TolC